MSIEASVENRRRNFNTACVSPGATETTQVWLDYSLAAWAQERKEQTTRNISPGFEETLQDLQIRRTAKEDES